jgi:hypothetical protein
VTAQKRSRPSTSPVWEDFQKLFKVINGRKVRYAAKCLYCNKQYSALSSGGTGHLRRDRNKCDNRKEKNVACLSLKFLLILMVVCIIGSTAISQSYF